MRGHELGRIWWGTTHHRHPSQTPRKNGCRVPGCARNVSVDVCPRPLAGQLPSRATYVCLRKYRRPYFSLVRLSRILGSRNGGWPHPTAVLFRAARRGNGRWSGADASWPSPSCQKSRTAQACAAACLAILSSSPNHDNRIRVIPHVSRPGSTPHIPNTRGRCWRRWAIALAGPCGPQPEWRRVRLREARLAIQRRKCTNGRLPPRPTGA